MKYTADWPHPPSIHKTPFTDIQHMESRYLTMRDGVRIALDLYLPKGWKDGEGLLPTVLYQTRYFRSIRLRAPFYQLLGSKPLIHGQGEVRRRKWFAMNGFAWIDVDVRGSGASFGTRICPWSPDEIRDGREIVDWILEQPWSNQEVVAMGISYSGTTSECLLLNQHPAVKAISPRFSVFDVYTDVAFPGGIRNEAFLQKWGKINLSLDANNLGPIAGSWVHLLTSGVCPVEGDKTGELRAAAISDHKENYNVLKEARGLVYRDDVSPSDPFGQSETDDVARPILPPEDEQGSINLFSPHNYAKHLEKSEVPILHCGGWYDGVYAHSAIKRFLHIPNPKSRLILGPWNHGGDWQIHPILGPKPSGYPHDAVMLQFFQDHLPVYRAQKSKQLEKISAKDSGQGDSMGVSSLPKVSYYTLMEGTWKTADHWPPKAIQKSMFLDEEFCLSVEQPEKEKNDTFKVRYSARTARGKSSRWINQAEPNQPVFYPPRISEDGTRLVYLSTPLEKDLEVTGHPLLELYISSTATDGHFFGYLEDVDEKGKRHYVTEGMLRALHRKVHEEPSGRHPAVPFRTYRHEDAQELVPGEVTKLVFDLLPISYLFLKGHRIGLALTGADKDHFPMLPETPPTITFYRGGTRASRLILPVIP